MNHLSYSSISMYLDCARRWQGHYKQDLKSPPGEALIFGSVAHSVIETFITDKSKSLVEIWKEKWAAEMLTPLGKSIVWDETPDTAKSIGIRLFETDDVYNTLSMLKPKMVLKDDPKNAGERMLVPAIEREVHWKLEDVPDIVGYIDFIDESGIPTDFKTAGKMWSIDKAGKEIQPLFYLAALEQLGEHDHEFKFRHIVMTKTKNPRIEVFEEQRHPVELEFMERVIRSVWQGISSGLFIPNPTSWLCDPKYCGAWSVCVGKGR